MRLSSNLRGKIAGLPRPTTCLPVRRSVRRYATEGRFSPTPAPFWTTPRVLLFTAFAGSLTYLYGISDTSSFLKQDAKTSKANLQKKPVYAKKAELEKVSVLEKR